MIPMHRRRRSHVDHGMAAAAAMGLQAQSAQRVSWRIWMPPVSSGETVPLNKDWSSTCSFSCCVGCFGCCFS